MDWVDQQEQKSQTERSKDYFNIVEGDNRIQLLTYCVPLAQVWTGTKYEIAEEGAQNVSIKGVCWVLQDGDIKLAKLPYTVVKQIRALQTDPDYQFAEFPMPRTVNVKAKGAGTKEVEYSVIPGPKEVEVTPEVLEELAKKPTPEEMVEKLKNKGTTIKQLVAKYDSETADKEVDKIPF